MTRFGALFGRAGCCIAGAAASVPVWEVAVVVLLLATAVVVAVRRGGSRGPDEEDGGDGGPGGWGRRRGPRPPRDLPPGCGPDWWPEFERQFAAYVDRRATLADAARHVGPALGEPQIP